MTARALHRSSSVGHALSKMRRMMLDPPIYIFHVVNIGPAIRPSMSMPALHDTHDTVSLGPPTARPPCDTSGQIVSR